jgi:UDP-glucose 4-epimerase
VHCDLRELEQLQDIFATRGIAAVVHCAGLKAVAESVTQPLLYYDTNLDATLRLLECMVTHGTRRLVFSSSATVYGEPQYTPIDEDHAADPRSPYGRTKHMIEQILEDVCRAEADWSVSALRYFNPIGAHPSGLIGESPLGTPNNLVPLLGEVIRGERDALTVFGDDYPTRDGTAVRDYIHVVDVARAHVAALRRLVHFRGFCAVNLGTGTGYSVRDVVMAFESAVGQPIPLRMGARRSGDVSTCVASVERAQEWLGWRAELCLDDMCRDSWRWMQARIPPSFKTAAD